VAGAARENEDVPDGVGIGDALGGEKDDARGVGQAAGEEQCQSGCGNVRENGFGGNDDEPAHGYVDRRGKKAETLDEPKLEEDAREGKSPDNAEERPAPGAPEINEEKRCVGSGDQEIDCRVIKNAERAFETGRRNGVIERRGGVEADEGAAIDGARNNVPGGSPQGGEDYENNKACNAEGEAETMRYRVGEFLKGNAPCDFVKKRTHIH